ncbi:NYN domain-containing protein [Roseobacter weihaiensis]|uniref:NYN domain-containing protein n=1 Tax=Roseobacter weihaiensis TaxID=2763262 RepID=UPI001D0A4AC9|nr:NYN domain-containing protein [Roseobacter sp. H9]
MARDRPLLAVLIDADNVPAKYASALLDEVNRIGEPALRRVYGDWSSGKLNKWSEQILSLGLVAHQDTANTTGKNASDIGLVIDAMDILHGGRFDGFVIVSSDSDFTALANRLREDGLMVIGIGETKAPEALRNVCNRFILIENLPGIQDDEAPADKSKSALPLNHAYQRIRNAMNSIEQDDDWYSLGQIKNAITASHSDFDQRSYGHAKFSGLVKALSDKIETKSAGNTILIRSRKPPR